MPRSPPRTVQQQTIFDELVRRQEEHRLSVADRAVMARNQFEGGRPFSVKTRARWPEGVPVRVTVSGHFGGLMPRELRATPDYPGGRQIVAYHGGVELVPERRGREMGWTDRATYEPGHQSVGTPPSGTREVVFETEVTEGGDTIWQGDVAQAILVDGTIDDILRPVDTPEVQTLIASGIDASLRVNVNCSRVVLVAPSDPLLSGVTMGVLVEFVHRGSVAATAVFRWRSSLSTVEQAAWRRRAFFFRAEKVDYSQEVWARLSGNVQAVCAADPADPEWHVRVRGDGKTALEDYEATAYWSGSATVPFERVKEGAR